MVKHSDLRLECVDRLTQAEHAQAEQQQGAEEVKHQAGEYGVHYRPPF